MPPLDNRLQRQRDTSGEHWVFRFANGLVVHTDPFLKADSARVLPLGVPQDAIMNRLVCHPEIVAGKRVFDPFSGSGVLGLMALKVGAAHVDFLDVSPRAQSFQRENAERNGFAFARYRALLGSIADHVAPEPYDVVLANPPFVPTPSGLDGTLTSNGGDDGNALVELLLARLDRLLREEGEAYVYVMQLVAGARPLIVDALLRHVRGRAIELTPTQAQPLPFADYAAAYVRCFPQREPLIKGWQRALHERHGQDLAIQHYIVHVQPRRPGATSWNLSDNLADKYCAGLTYPASANGDLALSRVMENYVG